jgi:hypothetical protein
MYRCLLRPLSLLLGSVALSPRSATALHRGAHGLPALLVLALGASSGSSWAQGMKRHFPPEALRGELVVRLSPDIDLNGRPQRLAPGSRIRSEANLLVMPATVSGTPLVVNYTLDGLGQVKDVWILTPQERAQVPWPTRTEQSSRWQFDPLTQTWTPR